MHRLYLLIRNGWRDAKSVYYSNTPVWRWLKSGTLILFGLFCWSAAALLLSYQPEWGFLTYIMAYGFLLIAWGPLTHFIIVPLVIRSRRTSQHPITRWLSRHGSKVNLTIFFILVIIFGAFTPGIMMLDFAGIGAIDRGPDVSPDLTCTEVDDLIECEISDPTGIDHVVVFTAGDELLVVEEQPFKFEIPVDDLETVTGQKQFEVEVRDADNNTLRRYIRTV